MRVGPSEAEPCWTDLLRSLMRRGLRGVKLVISDAHEGLKAAVAKVLKATWQRCRVHFMRNALAHWLQIHSTNPLECLNSEIKRRTDVVGIFPNDAAIVRLVGGNENDEWSLQRPYMQFEEVQ